MSNLQLSAEEMQLVCNSGWILTKYRIIEKVYRLFGNLSAQMQLYVQEHKQLVPEQALLLPPKISKGEQYEALPYVVLDYPRFFSKEDVFAMRSFFWWGNYFSITLHLKGKFQQQWYKKISEAVTDKKLQDFYFCCSGNEFSFNLTNGNYFLPGEINNPLNKEKAQLPFLKISYKIAFEDWDMAGQKLMQVFEQLVNIP